MKLPRFALFCAAILITYTARAQNPTVVARELRVMAEPPKGYDELGNVDWELGTTISLLVAMPDGGIIDFDEKASHVTAFKDDLGKDLLQGAKADGFRGAGIGNFPKITKDGKLLNFRAYSKALPTKGAKTITLAGQAVFQAATQKAEQKTPNVQLKEGTTFQVGKFSFAVTKVGKPEFAFGDNANKISVTLQAKQDLTSIAEMKFLDPSGKTIDVTAGGGSTMRFGGLVTIERSYLFAAKPDAVTVVIQHWTDLKAVTVPFSLTVGAGL